MCQRWGIATTAAARSLSWTTPPDLQQIAAVLQDWPAVILLCVCADVQTCHRKGVGEQLAWDLGQRCEHQQLPRTGPVSQLTLLF